MNNKLDNYFRDKLRDHSVQPSAASWEKVESRLSKKNSKAVVLKIAAAIALIGLATVVILDQTKNTGTPVVAKTQPSQVTPAVTSAPSKSETITAEKQAHVATAQPHKAPAERSSSPNNKGVEEIKTDGQATVDRDYLVLEAPVVEQVEVKTQLQPEKAKEKRIVIVYTLPTINKSPAPATALAEEEKRTGLQKVMDAAMEMRATESPLGDLREAKDDLFAFEFRKDKKSKN